MFLGLSEGQSLGLSEVVGEKDTVVEGTAEGIESGGRGNEISGNELGSLVNELVERVLTVGSGSAPDDGLKYHNDSVPITQRLLETATYTGLVIHTLATLGNELPVGLHVSLLEVIGELVKILIVGEKELSLSTIEVVVPDSDDS